MRRTLRYGSRGPDVAELQNGLNLLASTLAPLNADGIYGAKTTARVRELQGGNALVADGITGPNTWQLFLDLLAKAQKGGVPIGPQPPAPVVDVLRPLVLTIAQQHFGAVDFQQLQGGRPRGLDFLKEMFQVAAGVQLSDANFIDPATKAWTQQPWIDSPTEQRKSWCGLFCVYCYRMAGLNVSWSLALGKPIGPIQLNTYSTRFVSNIKQADIGCVASANHHFLIEELEGGGPTPAMSSIDGNQDWGRILRRSTATGDAHRVLHDNFNYYSTL